MEAKKNYSKTETYNLEHTQVILSLIHIDVYKRQMYGNGCIIKEPMAAFEYIEDILPSPPLFPSGPVERAEVRSYCYELLGDFMPLLQKILAEKVYKVQYRTGPPETQILREIREETAVFMDIIGRQTIAVSYTHLDVYKRQHLRFAQYHYPKLDQIHLEQNCQVLRCVFALRLYLVGCLLYTSRCV